MPTTDRLVLQPPGTYTVTHTVNSSGCTTAASLVIVVNPTPTITAASGTAPACAGNSATLIATGGPGSLSWKGPNSYSAAAGGTTTISNFQTTSQGIYTLTVNNFGCATTSTVNLVMPAQPTATVSNTGPYCIGQTIQLNATTSFTALSWSYWYNVNWTWWNFSTTTTPTITNAQTTSSVIYYFYFFSTNGCWAHVQISITVNPCVLPIELTNYLAHCVGINAVSVDWDTSLEKDCDYYEIRLSPDGITFETIGTVKAHGTSYQKHGYKFVDAMVEPDRYYYYKQVEVDNHKTKHYLDQLVYATCSKSESDVSVFPIPAINEIDVVSRNELLNADVRILDAIGRVVRSMSNVNLQKHSVLKKIQRI